MQVFVDDTGTQRSAPMFDEEGRPVHNQTAIARRSEMIEHLCAMPPIKPALDGIIEHYGPEKVAEVTGRSKRLIAQRPTVFLSLCTICAAWKGAKWDFAVVPKRHVE